MDFYMDYAPFSMPKVMRTSGRMFASQDSQKCCVTFALYYAYHFSQHYIELCIPQSF